jgi:hypothetical protein
MAKKKTSKNTGQNVTRRRPRFLRGWVLLWAAVIVFVGYHWVREQDFFTGTCDAPVGYQLVFDRTVDDITNLYQVNGTGKLENLTNSPNFDSNPAR